MRSKVLIAILSLVCAVSMAHARNTDITTVANAKKKHDDSSIVLEGRITASTGNEDEYWFSDDTGRIRISVDEDYSELIGKKVRISGEVDRDDLDTKIDAQHLTFIE